MHITEARRFEDLQERGADDAHFAFDRIFAGEGFRARRHSKKKFKLLKAVEPLLRRMLFEDEVVDFVTWGVQSSLMDAYFLGWVMYYLNRTAIVMTTHRIIMIRIDRKNRPRDLVRQLRYEAVDKVSRSWLGATVVKTKDRKKMVFEKLPKRDRRAIQQTLSEVPSDEPAGGSIVDCVENLCPHCWAPVDGRPRSCENCGGTFKSARSAAVRSLMFPGLGDWYLGHRGFAVMEILGAGFLWLILLLAALVPDPELAYEEAGQPMDTATVGEFLAAAAFIFIFVHGADAFVTGRIARAGIYPHRPPPAMATGPRVAV